MPACKTDGKQLGISRTGSTMTMQFLHLCILNMELLNLIVIWDKKKIEISLEVRVPNGTVLNRTEEGMITKYQSLMHEIKRNWNLRKISTILAIIGVTDVIKK